MMPEGLSRSIFRADIMAKLSGPEEFFEVFRHPKRSDRPEAQGEPLKTQTEPPTARPDLAFPAGKVPGENTVTVKVSTLVFAGVCALLLMILAYFAGMANAPEPAADKGPIAGGAVNTGLPANPSGGWELQMVSYGMSTENRRQANRVVAALAERPEVRACPVARVFTRETSNRITVVIGPFQSPDEPSAQRLREKMVGLISNGKRLFAGASFVRMPAGR